MIPQDEGRVSSGGQELATSTLAEIYAQQGLLERARAIYERIAQRTPGDPRIAERLETLARAIQDRSQILPSVALESGPPASAPSSDDLDGGGPSSDAEEALDEVFEAWLRRR